jgi:hypothetical protein
MEDAKARRVAHNPKDILSPFGLFQIICAAAHPDQEHIYHYKVPKDKSLRRQLDGFGFDKILLDAGRRMGKNKVGGVSTGIFLFCTTLSLLTCVT